MGYIASFRPNAILVGLALLYSSTLLVVAFNHLGFDDCSSEESEGKIFVVENATWLECKGGKLRRYCIAEEIQGRVDCVPHDKVKGRLDVYYKSWAMSWIARGYYVKDSGRKYADCKKIQEERIDSLRDAVTKRDCLEGLNTEDTTAGRNIYCTMTDNDVNYIEGSHWYTCKNEAFHLQRCVFKEDEEYKCVSVQKIVEALEASGKRTAFDHKSGLFCDKFFAHTLVYPDYESELEACSEFEEVSETPVAPVAPRRPAPIPEAVTEKPVEIDSEEQTDAPKLPAPIAPDSEEESTESSVKSEVETTTDDYEEYTDYEYVDETETPTTTTTTTARPRRRFTPRRPIKKPPPRRVEPRTHVAPPRPPARVPAVADKMECKINHGWNVGQFFDPIEAANRMMRRPLLEAYNRPDKLLNWNLGQMTLGDLLQVADKGYIKFSRRELDGPSIVELVEEATGADKCTVITEKLPINDVIYWEIAEPCKCTSRRCRSHA